MTSSGKLVLAALVTGVALSGASGEAPVSDPAEPPLKVEVSFGSGLAVQRMARPVGARRGMAAGTAAAVAVATGARGTTLTLNTPGSYQDSAKLTFKNSAPPMRLTLRLARMPNHDLEDLTVTGGQLSLRVGRVGTAATTQYYDAKGKAQDKAEGAAYTLTARRRDNGQVDVELRRGQGAALGKELAVSWRAATADALERELFLRAVIQAQQGGR